VARTRLWNALIIGLVQWVGMACTKSEPPPLTARAPLVLDSSGETLSLDETQVPIVTGCSNGQLVKKTGAGWSCADPGPGEVPLTWDVITGKPATFPPGTHSHSWSEVENKPATFPPAEHSHGFSEMTGVTATTEWPGTQSWSRVTGAPDFALSSTVGNVTNRVSSVEGTVTTAQVRLTQVEGRVGALETAGGTSSLLMSVNANDTELTGAGYSLVGLGRPEGFTARTSIPSAISSVLGAAVLGAKVYTAGGYLDSNGCTSNLWEYDLATDKWRARQQMSGGRYGQVVVGARGKVYSIGGHTCTSGTKINEIYDPQLNAWTQGAPLPDHNHYAAAYGILSDGKLHVVGGSDHSTSTNSRSHVVYDFDTNTWSTAPDLPVYRKWSASGALADGRLIVAGGHDGASSKSETYIFDPATNSWTQAASMPSALSDHSGAVIAGRFHTFGGYDTAARNYHYIYDPASDSWSSGAAVPYSGYGPAVAQFRGGALLVGGHTSAPITSVYEYLAPLYLYSK
jgi:hypothetical protein